MKPTQSFDSFYQSTLAPVVEGIELERKQFIKKIYIGIAIAIGALVLSGLFGDNGSSSYTDPESGITTTTNNGPFTNVLFLVAGAGAIGYFFWYRPFAQKFRSRFKTDVIARIVKYVNENLTYQPQSGISRGDFAKSSIFTTSGDRYTSEDLISGQIDKTMIRFSEVHTEERRRVQGDNGGSITRWVTLFRGVLFIADFHKHFKGRTVVLTDEAERTLGSLGKWFQKMNASRDNLVKMENTEFEKAYVVYSTDAIEAHYILSPSMMEQMLKLRSRVGNVQFSFIDSCVFVTFPTNRNFFEPALFKPINVAHELSTYCQDILQLTAIVDDLNLNTRIWTKE